jgi:iron complex transport system ATP-binding protein
LAKPETRVRILDRERWDLTELKRRMGVVSAELPGRQTLTTTGIDAILTGFFSSSTLWPNLTVTAAMRERAEEVMVLVGASGLREKPVGQMSAGQQRRVMIGRALAGGGEMLLLDEPSNALDMGAQHDLREMLRGLAKRGTAIVLITHQIADILPEMERVVMMREGRIAADGAKAELLTESKLSELFGREIALVERSGYFNAW